MQRGVAASVIALIVSLTAVANAQSPGPASGVQPESRSASHDVAVAIAVGGILSMDPDLGVRPFQWVISLRRGLSEHAVIEPEVGRWSYARSLGSSTTGDEFNENVRWTFVGANILARFPGRTASFFGGVGAGLYQYSCQRVGTLGGSPYSYNSTGSGVGLQAVAGIDVPVVRSVVVFGLLRVQGVPAADLGTTGLYAGVRYAF